MKKTDLRELDIFSLRAIDANKYYLAPAYSGIYIAINNLKEIVYIGKSNRIRGRIYNHEKLKKLNHNNDLKLVFFEVNKLVALDAEYAMISIYNPVLNKSKLPIDWDKRGEEKFFFHINTSDKWKVNEKLVKKI